MELQQSQEAINSADRIIKAVKDKNGNDYSVLRDDLIALFDNELFNGFWDTTLDAEDSGLPNLRIIEENEYDQSMDEGDKKKLGKPICYVGHYVFEA